MKLFALLLFISSFLNAGSINIAVAANVSYAIPELTAVFTKTHPDIDVKIILGSSGKLTAQISHGAPYGIFLSANMLYPQSLYEKKIATTKPKVYAKGQLAYLSHKSRDFSLGLELLKQKNISKIAIANPKTAPYGKATKEAMINAGVYNAVKAKLIYGESISQTLFFTSKAADIGIIAKSALFSKKMAQYKEDVHWKTLDSSLYTPIEQGIVLLKYADNNKDYKLFYEFILSKEAKNIFIKYGYTFS